MNINEALRYSYETARCMFEGCNNDDHRKHSQALSGSTDNREQHHVPGSEGGNDELPAVRHVDAAGCGKFEEIVGG